MTRWLIAALCTTAAACNSYAPDLGEAPFRCGASGGCPDGYACAADQLCRKAADSPATDAGGPDGEPVAFSCLDEREVEPNNDIGSATRTQVSSTTNFTLVASICPDTDVDLYRLSVTAATNLFADVDHLASRGQLIVEITNDSGTAIHEAKPVNDDPNFLHARITDILPGIYYVSVRAPTGTRNNYNLDIRLSDDDE